GHLALQKSRGILQASQRELLLGVAAHHGNVNSSLPHVWRNLDIRHGHVAHGLGGFLDTSRSHTSACRNLWLEGTGNLLNLVDLENISFFQVVISAQL